MKIQKNIKWHFENDTSKRGSKTAENGPRAHIGSPTGIVLNNSHRHGCIIIHPIIHTIIIIICLQATTMVIDHGSNLQSITKSVLRARARKISPSLGAAAVVDYHAWTIRALIDFYDCDFEGFWYYWENLFVWPLVVTHIKKIFWMKGKRAKTDRRAQKRRTTEKEQRRPWCRWPGGGSLEKSRHIPILWLLILSFFLYTIFWFASCRTIMGSSHAQRNSPAYREPQQDQGQGQQEELWGRWWCTRSPGWSLVWWWWWWNRAYYFIEP